MKRRFLFLILPVALAAPAFAAGSPDAVLTPAERERLVDLLQDGRDKLLAAVASMSDEAWSYKPSPDRWSAAEITEHLYKSEGMFQSILDDTLAGKADPEWATQTADKTDFLQNAMLDRSQKAQAPEPLKPGGGMSRRELVNGFAKARNNVIRYARETQEPVKSRTTEFGPFGPVNGMQLVLLRGAHTLRHYAQLEELMADPGFPK